MTSTTVITHGIVVTLDNEGTVYQNGAVAIQGGKIVAVGENDEIVARFPGAETTSANGRVVMPGFVCSHAHFYGMFSRGMMLHDDAPTNFLEVLERLWWRLDRALDEKAVRLSAEVCLLAAIKAGTTTIFDHHCSPSSLEMSLSQIAKCTTDAGVRASLCYEVSDRNGPEELVAGIAENVRFAKEVAAMKDNETLHAMFGIHSCLTMPGPALALCAEAVKEAGLEETLGYHVHVGEGADDEAKIEAETGSRVVDLLHKHGLTGPNSIFAHCISLNEHERDIVAKTGTQVVHNPSSNINNAVGILDVPAMLERGVDVMLGTDGMTMDMVQEHKFAYLLHKNAQQNTGSMSGESFEMLRANARMASRCFGAQIGTLTEGAVADVVVTSYLPPTPLGGGSMPWHMMFGMGAGCVDSTMAQGKWIMKDRKVLSMDEERIMRESCEHAPIVHGRIPAIVAADKAKWAKKE